MNYGQSIKENMIHLNTDSSEWTALELSGYQDDGRGHTLPVYEFPVGYSAAPSLFKNEGMGDMQCELCGHPIKTAYYIQHDGKKWLLLVGSECVTHFSEKSGTELTKETKAETIERDVKTIIAALRTFYSSHSRKEYRGYGKYVTVLTCSNDIQREYILIRDSLENIKSELFWNRPGMLHL